MVAHIAKSTQGTESLFRRFYYMRWYHEASGKSTLELLEA